MQGSESQRPLALQTLSVDGFTMLAGWNWPMSDGFLKPRGAGLMKQYFIVVKNNHNQNHEVISQHYITKVCFTLMVGERLCCSGT